jgi:hypothetical protein
MTLITDPADRLDDGAFAAALEKRYESVAWRVPAFAERYANVCDLACQLLWPEKYGTDPADDYQHTSDPARAIARLFFTAAGIVPDE